MLTLLLEIRPKSVNSSHGVYKGKIIKSKSHRIYKQEMSALLRPYQDLLNDFKSKFEASSKCMGLHIYFYDSQYWTKKKKMNQKSVDCSNIVKAMEDSIFDSMGLNDCFNKEVMVKSIPSDKDKVIVNLFLQNHAVMNEACF